MRPIEITWVLAAKILFTHARICGRVTSLIVATILGMFWAISLWNKIPFSTYWNHYYWYILSSILFIHFIPINIYAVKQLFTTLIANRYRMVLVDGRIRAESFKKLETSL